MHRQRRRLDSLWICFALVAVAVLGWLVGRGFSTPDDEQFDLSAPDASPVVAPVEVRELSSALVLRGDVVAFESFEVVSAGGGELGEPLPLTGAVPQVGTRVHAGDVLAEIGGRPVFILEGDFPFYRSLEIGLTGPDVLQLQQALRAIGFDDLVASGSFDASTAAALQDLYEGAGYAPPESSPEDLARYDAARLALEQAEESLATAELELQLVAQPPSESQVLQAEISLTTATNELARVQGERSDELARRSDTVEAAIEAETAAREEHELALAALNKARDGVSPTTGLEPTSEELDELVEAERVASEALSVAETQTTQARDELAEAENRHALLVEEAEDRRQLAALVLEELVEPPDAARQRERVAAARRNVENARGELADIATLLTPGSAPVSEFLAVPTLPQTVVSTEAALGSPAPAPLVELASDSWRVRLVVTEQEAELIAIGGEARATDSGGSVDIPLRVSDLRPALASTAAGEVEVLLEPSVPIDELAGRNLRVEMLTQSTDNQVMAVPLSAVFTSADGRTYVRVDEGGSQRDVAVRLGLTANGLAEVVPMESGALSEGDWVVVGSE